MGRKTILTCAVTGNLTRREQNPNLPITPREIARSGVEAAAAGAAVLHIHVRDPETGKGSMNLDFYRETVERIREKDDRVIVNLTTGEGGRFVPDDDDPRKPAAGTTLSTPERRVAHVAALSPEICTLDFNTMWSGTAVVMNTPRNLRIMAEAIYAAGTRPEIEIFDSGDLQMMKHFLADGILRSPILVQLVLGVRFGAAANPATLFYLVSQLPQDCIWAGFGIGRMSFPMLAQAFLLGGHVRTGLEDTVYVGKGKLASGNAQLVEKAVGIVESLGGELASPAEARQLLDLG